MGQIVTVSDGVGRSVTVSKWGVAQTSRHCVGGGGPFTGPSLVGREGAVAGGLVDVR
jgi:hypothetical protein